MCHGMTGLCWLILFGWSYSRTLHDAVIFVSIQLRDHRIYRLNNLIKCGKYFVNPLWGQNKIWNISGFCMDCVLNWNAVAEAVLSTFEIPHSFRMFQSNSIMSTNYVLTIVLFQQLLNDTHWLYCEKQAFVYHTCSCRILWKRKTFPTTGALCGIHIVINLMCFNDIQQIPCKQVLD